MKCQICKQEEALWVMQDIAGELSFYRPGYHIRGFKTTKVCDKCKEKILQSFLSGDKTYDKVNIVIMQEDK